MHKQKGFAQILLVVILLAGIIGGVYLVQQTQIFKSKAGGGSPYKIGAYYFGMFDSADTGSVLNGVQLNYHRSDMWGGVKDFYGGEIGIPKNPKASQYWPSDDFSYLKPQIGYYDYHQNGPEVLSQQINQAKAAGLSYFNFYWYWDDTNHREYLNSGLDSFLQAPNKNDLEFMISMVVPGDRDLHNGVNEVYLSISPSDELNIANTIVNRYFKQPNYLKTSTGRPIIYILAHQGIHCRNDNPNTRCNGNSTDLNNYIALLKQAAQEGGVSEPFVLVNVGLGGVNAEGYSCLNTGIIATPGTQRSYQEYINTIPSEFGTSGNVMPCFASNFDERPRLDIGVGRNDLRYFTGYSDQTFREGLIKVKQYMDSGSGELSKFLTIYAWNEWHEGGIIEPNTRDGNNRLQIISDVFHLIQPPKGTLDNATCSVILGWACDPNDASALVGVHIYSDGPYGTGTHVASGIANQSREAAVGAECGGNSNHGFIITTPPSLKDGGSHQIYAYQIVPNGSNPLLSGSPKLLSSCTISAPTPSPTISPTPIPGIESFEVGLEAGAQSDASRVDLVSQSGAKWVRLNFIEHDNWGSSDTDLYNRIINAYLAKGIKIIGLIGAESVVGGYDRNNPASFTDRFVSTADTIVTKFGDRVKVFELFNEPNDWAGGSSSQVTPANFALYMRSVYHQIKTVKQKTDIKLISGPIYSDDNGTGAVYLQQAYEAGMPLLDGIGYHMYVWQGSRDSLDLSDVERKINENLSAIEGVISSKDPGKKIWISEIGWGTGIGRETERVQAAKIDRAFSVLRNHPSVRMAMYFTLFDFDSTQWGLIRSSGITKEGWNTFLRINGVASSPIPTLAPSLSPSSTPTSGVLVGDINNDHVVNQLDLNLLITAFDNTGSNLAADLNHDSKVDVYDYTLLIQNYGQTR